MPRMDQATETSQLIKLLLIGDGKAGKTRFAGEAAADGFNLFYLSGDVAAPTLAQLPIEAKKRIYFIDAVDDISGGMRNHRFIDTVTELTTNIKFRWNDTEHRIAKHKDEGEVWEISPARMGSDCIFVLDAWTSLVESIALKCAFKAGVDLANATTTEMRPVYQSSALIATSLLQVIRSFPCHVIVLGHPDQYEHRVAPEGKKVKDLKETDMIIEWTKWIAKSTSRPHAMTMPKYFTDVAWLDVSPTGVRRLDFRPKQDRVGGGHFDGHKDTKEYSFANLVKAVGGTVPDGNQSIDHWLNIIPAGPREAAESKILDGSKPAAAIGGMAGLLKKPAAAG
jgi:hypothetical protein